MSERYHRQRDSLASMWKDKLDLRYFQDNEFHKKTNLKVTLHTWNGTSFLTGGKNSTKAHFEIFHQITKWVCQVYSKYQKQVCKWIRKEYLYCRPTALTNESLKPDLRKVASHIWENILSWVSKLVNQLEGKKKRNVSCLILYNTLATNNNNKNKDDKKINFFKPVQLQ